MTWPLALGMGVGLPLGLLTLVYAWSRPLLVVALVILSRVALDMNWESTYFPFVGSMSISKLYSAGIILLLGFYLWQQRRLDLQPIGVLVIILIASSIPAAFLTDRWGGFVNVAFRWLLPWLLAMLTLYAVQKTSPKRVASAVALCLSVTLINQAVGSAIYGPKFAAHSFSYVGTFEHELVVSFLLHGFIAMLVGLYGATRAAVIRGVLVAAIVAAHVGMYLANYRTALAGLFAYWVVILIYLFPRLGVTSRVNLLLFGGIAFGIFAVTFGEALIAKFDDVRLLVSDPGRYFDFSDTGAYQYSDDREAGGHRLMSGRIEMFNSYIAYWVQAPLEQKIFGLGPEFGTDAIGWFAHNEFVSSFVEQGVFGLLILICVLTASFLVFRKAAQTGDSICMSSAALLIGLLVSTLAQMPFRDSRALILMGIALGFLEAHRRTMSRSARVRSPAGTADDVAPRGSLHPL